SETRAADLQELALGVFGQYSREAADEFFERLMDGDAEIGAAGSGIELVQRFEIEDMPGIDRIGVAQPGLDLRHRKPARARGKWRPRCRRRQRPVSFRFVDLLGGKLH